METEEKIDSNYDVVSVEKLVAFYAGEQLARPYEMFRLSTMKGARIYFRTMEDGSVRFYMGATSASRYLMTPFLLRWWADKGYDEAQREMHDKSCYGSYFHSLIAQLAKGSELSVKSIRESFTEYLNANDVTKTKHHGYLEEMVKDILSYLQWCEDFQVKPLAIELPLVSDTLGVGTLIDFVGTINDKRLDENGEEKKQRGRKPKWEKLGVHPCITDFKTGRTGSYETHVMQLQSNKELFQENYPQIEPIQRFYNLAPKAWRIEPTYTFTNQTDKMNQDRYDALLTLARTDLQGVLNRQIMVIEGEVKYGTSAKQLIRRFTISELVNSGEWQSYMPKEILV